MKSIFALTSLPRLFKRSIHRYKPVQNSLNEPCLVHQYFVQSSSYIVELTASIALLVSSQPLYYHYLSAIHVNNSLFNLHRMQDFEAACSDHCARNNTKKNEADRINFIGQRSVWSRTEALDVPSSIFSYNEVSLLCVSLQSTTIKMQ